MSRPQAAPHPDPKIQRRREKAREAAQRKRDELKKLGISSYDAVDVPITKEELDKILQVESMDKVHKSYFKASHGLIIIGKRKFLDPKTMTTHIIPG